MSAAQAVDEYLEYLRIVGDDDGGKLMSPEEYERYKKEMLLIRMTNRLYVSWTNSTGLDCKLIGPETPCFCGHRYRQHVTDFREIPNERPIKLPCKQKDCRCIEYNYLPPNIRCSCKHMIDEHAPYGQKKCSRELCSCNGFKSSYSCACAEQLSKHKTIVETADDRLARGDPIGYASHYQAMGGLTGFSSLIDGYMRLDPSGIGAPQHQCSSSRNLILIVCSLERQT